MFVSIFYYTSTYFTLSSLMFIWKREERKNRVSHSSITDGKNEREK